MEGRQDPVQVVWHSIKHCIGVICQGISLGQRITQADRYIIQSLNIPHIPTQQNQIQFISWKKPLQNRIKLIMDRSSLGNPGISGAGGLILDSHGDLLLAFLVNLGYGSSTREELMALLEGVKFCKRRNFWDVDIEIDSYVILSWLQRHRCGIWYLEDYWEEISIFAC